MNTKHRWQAPQVPLLESALLAADLSLLMQGLLLPADIYNDGVLEQQE